MFRHLFKLIWNKKKQNFLLITEMFVSFLVIFAVFTIVIKAYSNYRKPLGFDYKNVWVVSFAPPANIQSADSVILFHQMLKKQLLAMPQIKAVSLSGNNVPFSMSMSNSMASAGDQRKALTDIFNAEPDYIKVMGVQMKRGRWFMKGDEVAKVPVTVISNLLSEKLFNGGDAVGKMVSTDGVQMKVIGVAEDVKDKGDYHEVESGLYKAADTGFVRWANTMLLKVSPDADAAFEGKLFKSLSNTIGSSIEIEHLEKKRVSKNKLLLVPIIILLIVGGFLIINVALGLFGVLWYNISRRRSEIGLRRAMGATGSSVSWQLVGEALVLSTLAILIGFFFAVQFPLLNIFDLATSVYLSAIGLSALFIYLLVFLCALYPGRQAAAIYPAVALHEE